MECDNASLFDEWAAHWKDLIDFEIVPVVTGARAAEMVADNSSE